MTNQEIKKWKEEAIEAEIAFSSPILGIDWDKSDLTMFKGPRHTIKYMNGFCLIEKKMFHIQELNAGYHTILGGVYNYPPYDINLYGCWIESMYRMWRRDNGK